MVGSALQYPEPINPPQLDVQMRKLALSSLIHAEGGPEEYGSLQSLELWRTAVRLLPMAIYKSQDDRH